MIIDLFEWTLAKIDFDGAESAKKLNMNSHIVFLKKVEYEYKKVMWIIFVPCISFENFMHI